MYNIKGTALQSLSSQNSNSYCFFEKKWYNINIPNLNGR